MKKQPAGKFRTKEEWRVIRAMVEEEGMTLTAAAEKAGIPYSTVQGRARIECWNPPHGIIRGRPRNTEILAAQAKKIEAKLAREEVLLMAEASLVKAQDLEVLARKSLVADSARLRVAISRRIREIVARLDDPGVPVRSAAQALAALAPILKLVFGWGHEPGNQRMERAVTSYIDAEPAENPTGAVNLALIRTTPAQLAEMAKAKVNLDDRDDDHDNNFDDHSGPSATECNGHGLGPSLGAPEQPPAATHGRSIPQKEAPPLPVNQPVQPRRENTVVPPPPLSPQERRRQELEELARRRADWRGWR